MSVEVQRQATIVQCASNEYHAMPELSRSQLWSFRKSARRFHAQAGGDIPRDAPSEEMQLGSLVHAMLLEPTECGRFVAIPQDLLSSDGKATTKAAKAFKAEHPGREVVTQATWETAINVADRLRREEFGRWFEGERCEETIVWRDEETGIDCRCRLDVVIPGENELFVFDLKTTKDASPSGFRSSVERFGYWFQYAHYSMGCLARYGDMPNWRFIVAATLPPYEVAYYSLSPSTQDRAIVEWHETIRLFAKARCDGNWRSPWDGTSSEIHLNEWAFNK